MTLLAAIDLGSNSFRLEIGQAMGSHIARRGYWKETVRLAAGIGADNHLSRRAIDNACVCLARMHERLQGMDAAQVRAVGTQTLRQALNSDQFLEQAQRALGYPIDIISGREEARLIFEGCTHTLPPSKRRRLVVDIGGASTEVIVGRGFTAAHAESFKIGCVGTTLRFFPDGRIDRGSFRRAQVACAAELEEARMAFHNYGWDEAYGSSGTIGAAAVILRNRGWGDGTITASGLTRLREVLLDFGEIRRVQFDSIKTERADVLVGGIAALWAIFETFGIHEMRPAKGALRAGLLYDLLGRRARHDVRDATVLRWQQRYGADRPLARTVATTAQKFYHAVLPDAPEDAVRTLRFACQLHEIGFAVSHSDYHKHSAYLVRNGDLPGFSTSDQERIAELVLGQRGNLRKVLNALWDPLRAGRLLALRLATILHHARHPVRLPRWTLRAHRSIEFGIDRAWIARRPLTRHLLEEEAQQWARVGISFYVREL
ncbi:MAG TPA: Ppx/GppA phosphatase family protein [Burkholderiaceae bacterium]|nr:Ppx/GppA phosphatase family protein [Burkholderiaceae bacterium]HYA75494.1 Ppx/GppA phosphatase family protein [Burkholderiaceae bacterium]